MIADWLHDLTPIDWVLLGTLVASLIGLAWWARGPEDRGEKTFDREEP